MCTLGLTISLGSVNRSEVFICVLDKPKEGRAPEGAHGSLEVEVFTIVYRDVYRVTGKRERKDLRVISRMQLVNGHEGGGGEQGDGFRPYNPSAFVSLCFAPLG